MTDDPFPPAPPEPRLGPADLDGLDPDVRAVIAAARQATGGAVNVFLRLAHHPRLFRSYARFGGRLLQHSAFPPDEREILILRTAWHCRCAYELHHHRHLGALAGLAPTQVDGLTRSDPGAWSPRHRALISAVDELMAVHSITDETWSRLEAELEVAQVIELPLLVGNYAMLAGLINALGVPIEPAP